MMAETAGAARAPALETTDGDLTKARDHILGEARRVARETAEAAAGDVAARVRHSAQLSEQEQRLAGALQGAKGRLAEAKRGYAQAMAEARYEDAAEFQEKIAETLLEVRGITWEQGQIDQAKKRGPAATDGNSRFEQSIAQLPDAAKAWCRQHPEFVTDERKNAAAQAAHFAAVAEGIREWSPEYWNFVDKRLGLKEAAPAQQQTPDAPEGAVERIRVGDEEIEIPFEAEAAPARRAGEGTEPRRVPDSFRDSPSPAERTQWERQQGERRAGAAEERQAQPVARPSASTAAPPSRGMATATSGGAKRPRQPTAGEIEAAKISFPDEWKESPKKALERYFENQAALRRQGRL
jgi:hypothetical protein